MRDEGVYEGRGGGGGGPSGYFVAENYAWKLIIIKKSIGILLIFVVWFFGPKCPNTTQLYTPHINSSSFMDVNIFQTYNESSYKCIYAWTFKKKSFWKIWVEKNTFLYLYMSLKVLLKQDLSQSM